MQLRPKHDRCEDCEEQGLRDEEQQQHDGGGGRVRAAVAPLVPDARHELVHRQRQRVDRYRRYVELERDDIFVL